MTREEAIKILRREIECLSHTKCEDCILEAACDPIKTTPYDSEYIEVYEIAIKALEQEPILDKIRAEIHATAEMHEDGDYYLRDEWIDEIIDKYKADWAKDTELNPNKDGVKTELEGET